MTLCRCRTMMSHLVTTSTVVPQSQLMNDCGTSMRSDCSDAYHRASYHQGNLACSACSTCSKAVNRQNLSATFSFSNTGRREPPDWCTTMVPTGVALGGVEGLDLHTASISAWPGFTELSACWIGSAPVSADKQQLLSISKPP